MRIPALCALLAGLLHAPAMPAADAAIPTLRAQGSATQLIVDGEPFLMLAGETGNSSGEPDYLRPHWQKFRDLHLNTLLVPVYWDLVEPREGEFDFASVDGMLADARANEMRLVLLWFGSWKNSMSAYAPAWVKRDAQRFPRARDRRGIAQEILSPFYPANLEADARAFAALMAHLHKVDGKQHTVLMVQVENEVGMLPDARDHSTAAGQAFAEAVPAELMEHLSAAGDEIALRDPPVADAAGDRRAQLREL
jgi:beta-galactosidase GanA